MKILAIADRFIPSSVMEQGLAALRDAGSSLVVREWPHASVEELQRDNLRVEQGGPGAIRLPTSLYADLADFNALVVQFAPVPASALEKAGGLDFVAVLRSGTENVDLAAATEAGIAVMNTPGRNARAVAEFALGLMLAETRNIARTHEALKKGVWLKDFPNGPGGIPELYRKTVGLVGFGQVARLLAGYLAAFGCTVVTHDPFYAGDFPGVLSTDLDSLLRTADIVSVHARYGKDTHGMIGDAQFALMKRTAILVNTARSGLVDQEALVRALKERRITGAAVDVFDREPIPADDGILTLDNITITPHLAGSTADAFSNSPRLLAATLLAAGRGEGRLNIVNGVEYPMPKG